jgi:DNA-directed RNA polymerase subunit M
LSSNPKQTSKIKKKRGAKFCPRCGSTDVFWAQGLPQLWSIWQCHNCGYQGPVVLEDGKTAEKIQEKWRKQRNPTNP